MERSGGLAFSARGPRGDRSPTVGGRERARTDTYTGCTCSPARSHSRSSKTCPDRHERRREERGMEGGGERGQCNVGPRQAVSSTVDRPVAAVSSQLLSRPSCDDGLICVN